MKKKKKSAKKGEKDFVNEKMSIGYIVEKYPESSEVFLAYGMFCIGCPAAMNESLREGVRAHGGDSKKMAYEINKKIREVRNGVRQKSN